MVSAGVARASDSSAASEGASAAARIRRRIVLGRSQVEVPDIGFGSFGLEHDEGLVHHALDRGITHFDTAESYTHGRSETTLGRALRGRRQDVTITTKYWATTNDSAKKQMEMLDRSLERLQTDYVDVYLNHAVNDVARVANPEWQLFAERAKAQGKIRAIGISGHAGRLSECLAYVLDHDLVDTLLVAYNFSQQPSFRNSVKQYLQGFAERFDVIAGQPELPDLLARAHAQGVGVQVMKTLRGARKNDMRPYEAPGRSFAQAAFRWVLSDSAVDGLVVSMNTRAEIDEYVAASGTGPPKPEDLALLARYEMRNAGTLCLVGCADCANRCPASVPIADVMRMRMYDLDYGQSTIARSEYARLGTDASACLECSGAPCANACSAGLDIAGLTRDTHRRLRS
jgi:hypothetical protein